MAVHRIDARIRTRTFLVTYWPHLDAPPGSEIKFGVFGDLRMGKRYALGLIARTSVEPDEIDRAGRLARRLVENPYKALRERYEEIWATPSPQDAFERMLSRSHSSLVCSDAREATDSASVGPLKEDLEVARTWCMDRLRPILRQRFHDWVHTSGAATAEGREQLDEREESLPTSTRRAAG